jgi:hypothetical protein
VSHRPARKQHDCLNCGAVVYGRYCHICGQENVEPKESFWHLVTHFVYDITHFDGKFFSTVKYLLTRPGFLSAEYIVGRRMRYLNPIKMYVFTSAIFFVFFFAFVKTPEPVTEDGNLNADASGRSALELKRATTVNEIKTEKDQAKLIALNKRLQSINADLQRLPYDSIRLDSLQIFAGKSNGRSLTTSQYKSIAEYDSAQQTLPAARRDGWMMRKLRLKNIELNEKFGRDKEHFLSAVSDKFFHSFPQILFISLPIIALLLKLLYIRRTQFYFADHAIYLVHLYCALFILIFLRILGGFAVALPYLHWLNFVNVLLVLYCFWYVYKSMWNFYKQRTGKTLLKYFLLLLSSSFVIGILFVAFGILSLFTV